MSSNQNQWAPFFFFLPFVILPVYPVRKSPSVQSKVCLSPQKPLPAPNFFPPDIDAIFRGAVGGSLLNRLEGVRNKLHMHTNDQLLIVTSGKGICATEKEEVTVFSGDVILFPAGEKHWHGAVSHSDFSHIVITGKDSKTTQIEE